VVESLSSTLKHEVGLDDDAMTRISPRQLQRDLAFSIDDYYNRERRHSTLNYLSPID
jgi:transposase InsO family protein